MRPGTAAGCEHSDGQQPHNIGRNPLIRNGEGGLSPKLNDAANLRPVELSRMV
jgi:hypothetical protein